jgi:hypothetical protein
MVCSTGYCVDGVAVEIGYGEDRTSVLRISLTDNWRKFGDPYRRPGINFALQRLQYHLE